MLGPLHFGKKQFTLIPRLYSKSTNHSHYWQVRGRGNSGCRRAVDDVTDDVNVWQNGN